MKRLSKTDTYPAYARNKMIAEAFYLTGDIEKYGSGLMRIRKAIAEYPTMKVEYKEIGAGFMSTISYRNRKTALREDSGGVNDKENLVLDIIKSNPGLNALQILGHVDMSKRTLERTIKELRMNGLIEFRGAPKTGGYFLNKNE